jgi:hypothetical protein
MNTTKYTHLNEDLVRQYTKKPLTQAERQRAEEIIAQLLQFMRDTCPHEKLHTAIGFLHDLLTIPGVIPQITNKDRFPYTEWLDYENWEQVGRIGLTVIRQVGEDEGEGAIVVQMTGLELHASPLWELMKHSQDAIEIFEDCVEQ